MGLHSTALQRWKWFDEQGGVYRKRLFLLAGSGDRARFSEGAQYNVVSFPDPNPRAAEGGVWGRD